MVASNIDRWTDIDFSKDDRFARGCNGSGNLALFGSYEDRYDPIPQSEWMRLYEAEQAAGGGNDRLISRVKNQRNEGSCVGNAATAAVEVLNNRMFGGKLCLSAIYTYQDIGSSPNSGANVSDALETISTVGCLPEDTPENRAIFGDVVMPPTGYYTKRPKGHEAVAKKFRVTEWLVGRTYEGLISALFRGHPVVVGRDGHSICYLRAMFVNGSIRVKYVNSWGDWGDEGFGYDSINTIKRASGWWFCPQSMVTG